MDAQGEWIITFFWKGRKGGENKVTIPLSITTEQINDPIKFGIAKSVAKSVAETFGYPGHKGGWFNWLVDDINNWLSKYRLFSPVNNKR